MRGGWAVTNVINLNRFRKQKERAEKEKTADENRVKYGRRKGDIVADKTESKKHDDFVDGHKRDDDDDH